MPELTSLLAAAEAPRPRLNGDGAIVAVVYTPAQWSAVDERRKVERGGHRSVVVRCPVRGVVPVAAIVEAAPALDEAA